MKILFICTHNRCRSILAEAIANYFGEGLIEARSAGSQPAGQIHPLTLRYLEKHSVPTRRLKSRSWDDLADFNPDFVITVCDKAAEESCPVWFGNSRILHWSLRDPSSFSDAGTEKIEAAFSQVIGLLKYRIMRIRGWLEKDLGVEEISQKMEKLSQ